MTKQEKAIREFCGHHANWWPSTTQVQEMLALAQPEQEPVAIRYDFDGYGYQYIDSGTGSDWQTRVKGEPLYTTPKIEVGCAECGVGGGHALYCVECAEKYLEDKNTRGQE